MDSSSTLHIHPAERRDVPALGRLGARLLRAHHTFDSRRFMSPGDDAEGGSDWCLGTRLDGEHDVVGVAEQDGAVVGHVYASVEPMSWKELRMIEMTLELGAA